MVLKKRAKQPQPPQTRMMRGMIKRALKIKLTNSLKMQNLTERHQKVQGYIIKLAASKKLIKNLML